jgi:putative transposase
MVSAPLRSAMRWTRTTVSACQRPGHRHSSTSTAIADFHGEPRALDVDVSERRVSRLLEPHTRPPSQTWKTFQKNHIGSAAAMDFFTVPTVTRRTLFVLVVLSHCRRCIVPFDMTAHPTATWAAQQVVDAFPDDTAPRGCTEIGTASTATSSSADWREMGIAEVVSAPASPWQNPYVERLIGSIRRECLDHVIVLNQAHLRRILTIYSQYYNDVSYCPTSLCA